MTFLPRQAQPPLPFRAPALNRWILQGAQLGSFLGIKVWAGVTQVQAEDLETLVEAYRRFQAGEIRLMLAYRHPTPRDPVVLFHLLAQTLPKAAARQQIKLAPPLHAHFIYDRGIPIWAGPAVAWVLPRVGASPIQRGRPDRLGLRTARHLLVDGPFPLAIAPEGGTNGHNEIVGPLEPGAAQLGFWGLEDLRKEERSEDLWILPLGVQYRFEGDPWPELETLLQKLERDCGLPVLERPEDSKEQEWLYRRLVRLGEHLLTQMEDFYHRFYHKDLKQPTPAAGSDPEAEGPQTRIYQRLQTLLNAALQVAEEYFGLTAKGTVIDRCRRIEQAGWDRIFRQELESERVSALDRGLADRIAEEANLRMWHMRLVESFVAVTGRYVAENPTAERFADTLLPVWDLVHKLEGEVMPHQPQLAPQRVIVRSGQPLVLSERWSQYQTDRKGARQAVTDLTTDLQQALESLIYR